MAEKAFRSIGGFLVLASLLRLFVFLVVRFIAVGLICYDTANAFDVCLRQSVHTSSWFDASLLITTGIASDFLLARICAECP